MIKGIYGRPLSAIVILVSLIFGAAQTAFAEEDIVKAKELIKQLDVNSDKDLGPSRSMSNNSFHASPGGAGTRPAPGATSLTSIKFGHDSATLTDTGRKQVAELAVAILSLNADSFDIVGHTDGSGDESYNQQLSKDRAQTVVTELVEEYGVDRGRLSAIGKGESDLADTANPMSADNRRVEVITTRK